MLTKDARYGIVPIDCEVVVHNVGQGLFYSGRIGDFNFVYDCGAEGKTIGHLNSRVRAYKMELMPSNCLDLLILSHLHADHVSGLKQLFEGGFGVSIAVLPYLTPIERLMVAYQAGEAGDWVREDGEWLYDFWADPVSFLIEQGVEKVMLIGGREGKRPPDFEKREEAHPETEPKSDESPKRIDYDGMTDDEGLGTEVISNDPQLESYIRQNRLLIKNHDRNLNAMQVWSFRFFNYKLEDAQQKTFEDCLRNNFVLSDARVIIKDKSLLKKLKTCYKVLEGNFNDTSLIVFHGPTSSPDRYLQDHYYGSARGQVNPDTLTYWPSAHFERIYESSLHSIGNFLTGDVNLNLRWNEIAEHFDNYLSKTCLVLIPHHGSIKNWNHSLLSKISTNEDYAVWVASAGINNKYHHPDFSVFQEISQERGIPFYCNEVHELRVKCFRPYLSR